MNGTVDYIGGVQVSTTLTVARIDGVWHATVVKGGLTTIHLSGFSTHTDALTWAVSVAY